MRLRCLPRRPGPGVLLVAVLSAGACSGGGDEGTRAQPPSGTPQPAVSAGPSSPSASPRGNPAPARTANPWRRLSRASDVATRLSVPWSAVFLPDGTALVSERTNGHVLRLRPGRAPQQVADLPSLAEGEAGLLGLAVSPTYVRDGLVYAYYTTERDNRVVRFPLGGTPHVVLRGIPRASFHDGGRIAFGPDGMLYVGTGETGEPDLAQDRSSLGGKILRLRPDGLVPADNPFPGSPVWSVGHRNVQGLAWDPQGRMYATEFGQNRVDEVNRILPGRNYGWPEVEGKGGGRRFVDPLVTWGTDEASPSGLAYADGALWVAALRGERLWRVGLDGSGRVTGTRSFLSGALGRIRNVTLGPDGALWLTTSNRDGRGDPRRGDDRVRRVPVPR